MHRIRTLSLLIVSAVAAHAALGAQQSTREAFYRCKDAQGQTHYGDSKPAACANYDTEVLNDRGMVLRIIEGDQSRVAREAREKEEKKATLLREQREQRDRMLIETYLSVEDIERLRDQRMDMVNAQYKVTEQSMKNMRDRQSRLESQIARFKPYNEKPNAPPLPDHLAEEMVNMVRSLQVYEEALAKYRKEQTEIRTAFDADIKRFKELKGIR
jgi:hypothetical protein